MVTYHFQRSCRRLAGVLADGNRPETPDPALLARTSAPWVTANELREKPH